MEFNSDFKFNNNTSRALSNIVDMYKDLQLTQPNYQIFIFCTYLGLTLERKEDKWLENKREEVGNDLFVPRNILIRNEYTLKELMICAEFVRNHFNIDNDLLQKIWNQQSFSDNDELKKYIFKRAEVGSCYFENLLNIDGKGLDIATIVRNINKRVDEMKIRIESKIQSNIDGTQLKEKNLTSETNLDLDIYIDGLNDA